MEPLDPATGLPVEDSAQQPARLTRRDFFGLSWRVLTAFAAAQAACIGLRFLSSRKAEGTFGKVMIAGLLADFPMGTITPFDQDRFFLMRFEDGGFLALHTKCTHLACVVGWNEAQHRFSCPCHGSEFERDGRVINPPAPRPLDRFPVLIEGDRVRVDTRQPIVRTETSPDELVYAPDVPIVTPTEAPPTAVPTPTPYRPPSR